MAYLKRIPKKTALIGVYGVIVVILIAFLLFRVFASPDPSIPEADLEEEEKPGSIDVEEIFDSAAEEDSSSVKEDYEQDNSVTMDIGGEEEFDSKVGEASEEDKFESYQERDKDNHEKEEQEKSAAESEEKEQAVEVTSAQDVPEALWPVTGDILTTHGELYQVNNQYRFHNGIDIKAPEGEEVKAAWDGVVETVSEDTSLGLKMVIASDGFSATYANLESLEVEEGQQVYQGEEIGIVGTTAELDASEGSYLHFSVLIDDRSIDPKQVLPDDSH